MKLLKKILIILFITIVSTCITTTQTKAVTPTEIMSEADRFLEDADNRELFNEENQRSGIDQIYYIGLSIAIVVAFFVGAVLGIQFITSGAAGQAKVKEKLIPFVVGAFVVFGVFGIWKLVYNALNNFF